MNHLRYLWYMVKHKWFVFLAGLKTGVPIWRLIVHDYQKFTPSEWNPYVDKFFGGRDSFEVRHAFDLAFFHHVRVRGGKHHWQYWVWPERTHFVDGSKRISVIAHEIPDVYIREMVADWSGAGRAITGDPDPREWFRKQLDENRIFLNYQTRVNVEQLMIEVWG